MRTVRVLHPASGRAIIETARVAETALERLIGLMGKSRLSDGEALLLPDCSSIHMFFMRFPIDAVYLDRNRTVRKIVHNLKPWRLSWSPNADSVLEAPAGWADRVGLASGDRLILEPRAAECE